MGNPKFRFSEIIPNAWFHKLNNRRHKPHPPPSQSPPPSTITTQLQGELPLSLPPLYNPLSPPRKSYYFTREFHPPLKSSTSSSDRRKHPTTTTTRYSPVSTRNCRADSLIIDEESDVVIEVDKKSLGRRKTGDSVSSVPSVELRPIRTERNKFSNAVKRIAGAQEAAIDDDPIKQMRSSPKSRGRRANGSFSVNVVREGKESIPASSVFSKEQEQRSRSVRRSPTGSPRFRIRVHSPRIARRAQMHSSRSSLSSSLPKKGVSAKSLAVVKSSSDPQRDFRESMVEMIVENKITAPKDLEELLACYLSLNSEQYHDVITQVFAQIWFDLNNILKEIKK